MYIKDNYLLIKRLEMSELPLLYLPPVDFERTFIILFFKA